jgi:phage shock protein A
MRLFRRSQPPVVTPASVLDEAYDARLRALERIRAASGAVHASRARLESSVRSSAAALERLEAQARTALAAGDEDTARAVAARCVPIDADIAEATEQIQRYQETERNLETMRELVAEQLTSLRKRRETLRGSAAGAAALDRVRSDVAALAADFGPVEQELAKQPN